ncbi:unnamed protein product, partial [Mesorhabditis belari]|uniref:C-type lectin domain-containing protein n=1 Tax=Mesorhabditis belari TaxID=2138241 RepID=A0AAF3F7W6_9BILA
MQYEKFRLRAALCFGLRFSKESSLDAYEFGGKCVRKELEKKKINDFGLRLLPCDKFWKRHGDFCYRIYDEHVPYEKSMEICRLDGANLVSIHGEKENDFVSGLAENNWIRIGLVNQLDENKWKWNDGSSLDYTNWASNQPDNLGTEKSTHLSTLISHKWANYPESTGAKTVCKKAIRN